MNLDLLLKAFLFAFVFVNDALQPRALFAVLLTLPQSLIQLILQSLKHLLVLLIKDRLLQDTIEKADAFTNDIFTGIQVLVSLRVLQLGNQSLDEVACGQR
ncbi:hypothetical protein B0T13DRAFT_472273 [Neurospora crassa]|nr:hypothetical protein B0T13DRAFT_472273 [Neurospora crassa]